MIDVEFNGVSLSQYAKILDVKRDILPPRVITNQSVPNRAGTYFFSVTKDSRSIEVSILIEDGTKTKSRELASVIDTELPASLRFSDDIGVEYMAILSGETNLERIVSLGKGSLVFFLPDPIGWGAEVVEQMTAPAETFLIAGNQKTYPTFRATFSQPSSFFAVRNSDALNERGSYVLVGDPTTVEEVEVPPKQVVLHEDGRLIDEWVTAPSGVIDGTISGSFTIKDGAVIVSTYGNGSGWHGPALQQYLPSPIQDFVVEAFVTQKSTAANQTGRVEIYLLDPNEVVIGKLAMKDPTKNYTANYGEAAIGSRTDRKHIINYVGNNNVWNNFYGKLQISRIGNVWSARIGKYDPVKGRHYARIQVDYTDIAGKFAGPLNSIVMHIGIHGLTQWTTQSIDSITVTKINQVKTEEKPLIFQAGDVLEIDHYTNQVFLNGELYMSELNPGSNFFALKPGAQTLGYAPDGAASVEIKYRSRWT